MPCHNPRSILIFLFGLFCLSTTAFSQVNPNTVRGVKDETGTAKPAGNQYALVVGVSKYHNIQTLLYADDDAVSFKDFLLDTKLVPEANIHTLIDSTATRSKFYAEIKKIMDKLKENDRVIIYFAGHGDVDNDIDAGFLLGFNCEATPYAASDAIDISMLERYVDAITKKNVKVILISDACRSGKLTGGAHGAELTLTALSSRFKNTIKILSCGPGELSEETNFRGGGHGIFTYYLLEGLYGLADEDNNNQITKKELDKFLRDKVSKSTNDRQNPIIEGNANEIILEVTAELKTAMLAKAKTGADAKSVATRSFSQKNYAGISLDDSIMIKKFYTQLRDGKLNTPEGDNAYETFLSAKKIIKNSDLVNSMKYDLAAGLEDDVQPLLNRFTRGEFQDYPYDLFGVANKKLQIIKSELITPDDYRYNDIEALRIFFSKAGYYNDDVLYDLLKADSILPNTAYINCEIARCYSEKSMPDTANAFKYFRKSIQLAPTWPFPHLIAGLFYMELKMYPEAKAAFEKALVIKNDFKPALLNTGVLYSKLKDDDKAISYYRQALQIPKPEIDVLYSNIGMYWKNKSNYDSALYYQRKAYEINPADIYNVTGLINSFIKLKQPDSIKYYTKQLENITPSYADEFKTIGSTYYDLAEYDKALKYFNKAQAIKINSDVYNNIGLTYDRMKNKEMAQKNFALALQTIPGLENGSNTPGGKNSNHKANSLITPSSIISITTGRASTLGSSATRAEDIRKIGDTYIDAMDYTEAVNYYTKALAVKSSPYIYNNLGLAYENLQKLSDAKKYYREALQMDPEYSISIRNIALLFSKAGNYDSAFYFLRRRLLSNPNDIGNLSFMLSNFAKLKQSDSISVYVKKLETVKTENATDLRDIADAFLDIPEYKKAVDFYLKALAIKPTTIAYNNLGLAYENLQRIDEAKRYYLAALLLNPDYSTSIRNLALLYSKGGQYDSAIIYFRKKYDTNHNDISNLSNILTNFSKLQQNDSVQLYAKKLEMIKTDNPASIREIADAFLDIADYEKAKSFYFKALAIKPSADIYNNLAIAYENEDKNDEAKKYYKMAVALQPDYSTSLRNLAILYNRTAKYDTSLFYYKKLYALSSADVSNLSGLAKLFLKLKQKDSAMVYMQKLENINTDNAADIRLIGDIYLDLPDYQKAIKLYNKALGIKPAEDIYNNLAIAYEDLEKYDDAKQAYQSALKIKPDYKLAISNFGSILYRTKNYDSAIILYKKLIALNSKPSASNYNSLADAFYSKSSYDSAVVYYKLAIALDSSHSNYFVNLGEAYYYLEQYAESVPYLEKAIAMDTSYTSSYSKLAYGYLFVKKYNDAIIWYKKAIAAKPDEGMYNNIAIAYEDVEKYDEAKRYYQLALKVKPSYALAMRNLAAVYYTTKSYDSSVIYYKKAMQINQPTAANYNSLADALYSSTHYDSAIVYYKKAIALDSSHSNYFVNLGEAYYYLQQYPESIKYLEKTFAMDTFYTSSYSKLAYDYLSVKRYNDAITWYKRAIAIKPDEGLYNNIALACENLEKYNEAKQYYQLAIKFKPDYVLAINNLASLYYSIKNYDSASMYYRMIIGLGKPTAANYNSLADALYSSSQYDSAIVNYKKAIALDATHSNYFVNLGSAYYYLQQYSEAIPYLEKAFAMDTSYASSYFKLAYGYMNVKKYDDAINLYNKILKIDTTGQAIYYYNIACAKSIQKKKDEALGYLDKTIKTGYTDLAHFAEDTDLDNIRSLPAFKKMMETYFKKEDIDKLPKLYLPPGH